MIFLQRVLAAIWIGCQTSTEITAYARLIALGFALYVTSSTVFKTAHVLDVQSAE